MGPYAFRIRSHKLIYIYGIFVADCVAVFFSPVFIHFFGVPSACVLDNAFSLARPSKRYFNSILRTIKFFCVASIRAYGQINYNIALATIVNEKRPTQKWVVVCAFRFQCGAAKWMTVNPVVWPQCRVQIRRRRKKKKKLKMVNAVSTCRRKQCTTGDQSVTHFVAYVHKTRYNFTII